MHLSALVKSNTVLFKVLMVINHSLSHLTKSQRCLQVFAEQRWLKGRGCYSSVILIETHLEVAGR
jgi:hypothetical protein